MPIIIRKANPGEEEIVASIGRRTFYETWKNVNTEEDLQLYMNKAFDTDLIRSQLTDGSVNTFLLAFEENELAGYAKLRNDRMYPEFGNDRALEMERIYVLRKFQDRKFGKALMDESIGIARKGGYSWLWLGVNQENSKAIKFYQRYGFEIFGTKQFILGTAVDEDFLMKMPVK